MKFWELLTKSAGGKLSEAYKNGKDTSNNMIFTEESMLNDNKITLMGLESLVQKMKTKESSMSMSFFENNEKLKQEGRGQ